MYANANSRETNLPTPSPNFAKDQAEVRGPINRPSSPQLRLARQAAGFVYQEPEPLPPSQFSMARVPWHSSGQDPGGNSSFGHRVWTPPPHASPVITWSEQRPPRTSEYLGKSPTQTLHFERQMDALSRHSPTGCTSRPSSAPSIKHRMVISTISATGEPILGTSKQERSQVVLPFESSGRLSISPGQYGCRRRPLPGKGEYMTSTLQYDHHRDEPEEWIQHYEEEADYEGSRTTLPVEHARHLPEWGGGTALLTDWAPDAYLSGEATTQCKASYGKQQHADEQDREKTCPHDHKQGEPDRAVGQGEETLVSQKYALNQGTRHHIVRTEPQEVSSAIHLDIYEEDKSHSPCKHGLAQFYAAAACRDGSNGENWRTNTIESMGSISNYKLGIGKFPLSLGKQIRY